MIELDEEKTTPDSDDVVDKLMNRVVNLATKVEEISRRLEEHILEPDAHNPGFIYKK